MLTLLLGAAFAACTFDATPERLGEALRQAESAYVALDVPEFTRAMTEVDFMVPCLVEPVDPDVAVRLHRIRGLGQFIDGDAAGADASLLAAKRLTPDYRFPEEVLPTGFELRDRYESMAPPGPEGSRRLPRPRSGAELRIDGSVRRELPTTSAALVQVFVDDEATASAYLLPDDPMVPYPGADRRRTALLVSAAATSLGSAVLYGGAWASRDGLSEATDNDDLLRRQRSTNTLVGASSGLAVASAVQVAVALWGERRR
jgi:hypothetical protein